jgi:hypothetical protein
MLTMVPNSFATIPGKTIVCCCTKCKSQLRLIALIKTENLAKKILTAMHLPVAIPQLRPARPPPHKAEAEMTGWAECDLGGAVLG